MSDDSFIREVNEEMRRDQAQALWDRFGPALLVLAILVVVGTAAFVGYRYWDETRANRSGDAFSQALKLANDGKSDEALTALDAAGKGWLRRLSAACPHARGDRQGGQGRR